MSSTVQETDPGTQHTRTTKSRFKPQLRALAWLAVAAKRVEIAMEGGGRQDGDDVLVMISARIADSPVTKFRRNDQ